MDCYNIIKEFFKWASLQCPKKALPQTTIFRANIETCFLSSPDTDDNSPSGSNLSRKFIDWPFDNKKAETQKRQLAFMKCKVQVMEDMASTNKEKAVILKQQLVQLSIYR